jgi:hypothetical protein
VCPETVCPEIESQQCVSRLSPSGGFSRTRPSRFLPPIGGSRPCDRLLDERFKLSSRQMFCALANARENRWTVSGTAGLSSDRKRPGSRAVACPAGVVDWDHGDRKHCAHDDRFENKGSLADHCSLRPLMNPSPRRRKSGPKCGRGSTSENQGCQTLTGAKVRASRMSVDWPGHDMAPRPRDHDEERQPNTCTTSRRRPEPTRRVRGRAPWCTTCARPERDEAETNSWSGSPAIRLP